MEKDPFPSLAAFPAKAPPQSEPSLGAGPEPREISEHMVLVLVQGHEHVILGKI